MLGLLVLEKLLVKVKKVRNVDLVEVLIRGLREDRCLFIEDCPNITSGQIKILSDLVKSKFNNSKTLLVFAFVFVAAMAIGAFLLTPKFDTEKNVLFGDLSLAVLPLKNVSNKKNDEPFVNGLSNSIRTLVAKTKRFSVISQTSSKAFANSTRSLLEIADELKINIGTSKSNLAKAKQKLKKMLLAKIEKMAG